MATKSAEAVATFTEGFNCSQAVFSTFSEDLGLSRKQALKIACGFGSGMSQTGNVCGAVTGAIMVISLKYGKAEALDNESRERTYGLVQNFIDEFKTINRSTNCTELVGYNLSEEKELLLARESGVFHSICQKLVKDSIEILELVLL